MHYARAGQVTCDEDEDDEFEEVLLDAARPRDVEPRKSWERSFPQATIEGCMWMLDVLEDLIAFANDRELVRIGADLQEARDKVRSKLLY